MRDQVKRRSPKKLKSLIEVPYVAHLKVQVLSSIRTLSLLHSVFLDQVIHFGKNLGDQVKDRSPKNLESVIEVPNVVHVREHVLSFNMILISYS